MLDDIVLTMQALAAASDGAEVHRLVEQEKVQWRKWEVFREIDGTMARQEAARVVGDDTEVRRLEEVMRPLRVRRNEIDAAVMRRHAARDSAESRRLVEEATALWDGLVEFWRADPYDPHTI